MSNAQSFTFSAADDGDNDRPALFPVIDPSRPVPLLGPIGVMTSDLRFAKTHLSPEEQRARWLAEQKAGQGGAAGGEGEGQGAGEEEGKAERAAHLLAADPANPKSPFVANTAAGGGVPLASVLSTEEQHVQWRDEQEKESVGQGEGEAEQAGGAA
ncbi:hypothetical protein JCM3775_005253 [Rhodotorula graminis]|uniref:Uncharacterized protein n=1 Tax=Rhodotorula graminis (strain WP1) TaxID=578459 RepID=A0A194SF88_RHOGW|nr:uncharacterized protein RHOBADRAFT_40784 [Rhodotorula graminis WP1]KPV78236.1 hypothetical protein RHOBADRAFT_40784 [Rhodotorula graminis WP1]